jgi:hypothetical protein
MQLNDLKPWLGDALAQLDADQLARLQRESDRIDAAHPEPDLSYMWDAAMSIAVQHVLGEANPDDVGRALMTARREEAAALAAAKQLAVMLVADGATEEEAAEAIGISRLTVRSALGKPHRRKA